MIYKIAWGSALVLFGIAYFTTLPLLTLLTGVAFVVAGVAYIAGI